MKKFFIIAIVLFFFTNNVNNNIKAEITRDPRPKEVIAKMNSYWWIRDFSDTSCPIEHDKRIMKFWCPSFEYASFMSADFFYSFNFSNSNLTWANLMFEYVDCCDFDYATLTNTVLMNTDFSQLNSFQGAKFIKETKKTKDCEFPCPKDLILLERSLN